MQRALQDLIHLLRGSGVRISLPESLEALQAARLVGYRDRRLLKDSLATTLAKSVYEKEIFDDCFERFFAAAGLAAPSTAAAAPPPVEAATSDSPLTQMLLTADYAGLVVAMQQAADGAGVSGIRFFTQKGVYIRRIMLGMGLEDLERDIAGLDRQESSAARQQAERLRVERRRLFEKVRDFVERQVALHAAAAGAELVERYLRGIRLSNLEERDFDRMQVIVRKIVKRLNDRHSRRRKIARRGRLDWRKTLRANLAYEGMPCDLRWKARRIDRPQIVVICDVSRSVAAVARFMLMFLYSLNQEVARIRSFIFCSNLVEVGHIFEEYRLAEALEILQRGSGLGIQLGSTNYGQSLVDFEQGWLEVINRKTTVLVLGDARNNYGDPRSDLLRLIHERCRSLIWLNPEPPAFWGTGDSEMQRYRPYCSVARECSTINHLTRAVDSLLRARG